MQTAEDWITKGDAFDDEGKRNEAIECFDKAIALNPNIARAYFLKGYVLSAQGLKDEALLCLEKAIELKPDYDTALNSKADILSSKGQHKEAIEVFDKAIAANPRYAIAIHNKGNSQRSLGLSPEALQSYDQALEIKPDYTNCYYSKAFTLNGIDRYSEVVECLEKLLPLTPNDVRALNLMGNALVKLDRVQESIQYYDRAIKHKSNTPLYLCNRGVAFVKLGQRKEAIQDFLVAYVLMEKGIIGENTDAGNVAYIRETIAPFVELQKLSDWSEGAVKKLDQSNSTVQVFATELKKVYDEMKNVVDEIFSQRDVKAGKNIETLKTELEKFEAEFQDQLSLLDSPGNKVNIHSKSAEEWIEEGDKFDDEGKSAEALECFDNAIALNPNIARAHFLKGYVLSNKGLKDQAITCLDKAIELNPDYDTALNSKADIFSSRGEHKEAIEIFDRAIAVNPKYAIAIHNKGNSQRAIGMTAEALQSYEQALEIKPDYANCFYSKAFALNELERYLEAVESLEKLLPLTPNDVRALNLMGNCHVKLGKEKESIPFYTKALAVKPETPLYYCNRGVAYKKIGQKRDALNDFLKAKELYDKKILGENVNASNISFIKDTIAGIPELQKELNESEPVLQQQVSEILKKGLLQEIREQVNSKLNSFKEKLEADIQKLEVSPEDRNKVKEYSNAFLETFNSSYVTTQVVENGQIQLDSEFAKETLLSAIASFSPFLGSSLSEGVKSLKDFVDSKEFKKNARKIKSLADNPTTLSQIIGEAVVEIVLNKNKQQQVIKATGQELRKIAGSLIVKIQKFCDNLDEDLGAFLYTKLYKTPAAMMGHYDANKVIQKWMEGEIVPFDIQSQFVEIVVGEGEGKN